MKMQLDMNIQSTRIWSKLLTNYETKFGEGKISTQEHPYSIDSIDASELRINWSFKGKLNAVEQMKALITIFFTRLHIW